MFKQKQKNISRLGFALQTHCLVFTEIYQMKQKIIHII